jgi:hypothetical protein
LHPHRNDFGASSSFFVTLDGVTLDFLQHVEGCTFSDCLGGKNMKSREMKITSDWRQKHEIKRNENYIRCV